MDQEQLVCMYTPRSTAAIIASRLALPGSRLRLAMRSIGGRFQLQARALATPGRSARTWDVKSGAPILTIPHRKAILAIAFSPDGKRLLTGCLQSGAAHQWHAQTGKPLGPTLKHLGAVEGAAGPSTRAV